MLTTEQLSVVMALPLVNLTNASKHDCEFTQDFTKEEVILKKELEDEQKKKSCRRSDDQVAERTGRCTQKLRLNEDQAEKLKKELEEKNSC